MSGPLLRLVFPWFRGKKGTKLIMLDPNLAIDQDNLNRRFLQRLDFDATIARYNQMIERLGGIDGQAAPLFNNRGAAYYYKNELDHAIKDYDRALQLDPTMAVAYCNRGLAYYKKRNLGKAVDDLKRALSYRDALPDRGARVEKALPAMEKWTT